MAEKKYYWLKLKRDFFKRHDIRIIEEMPNGKDYILFYLKLLCESVDHDGSLRFSDQIPYNEQMLSTITFTNPDIVRSAVQVFRDLRMMEILDDGTIYMNEVREMTGSETEWAEKKRLYRERVGRIEDNSRTKKDNVRQEKEKEKEKEKDKKDNVERKRSDVSQVIDYLNLRTGREFKSSSKTNQKHILARLNDGFTVKQMCDVIDKKCREWMNDPKMSQYLRPETLFGSKFEAYLNAPVEYRKDHIVIEPPAYVNEKHTESEATDDQIAEAKKLQERMK